MKNAGIYVIRNNTNFKEYVGLDRHLPRRVNQHLRGNSKGCRLIHRAIKKHGRDNFTVEIIRYPNVPHQILCWFERSHIAERDSKTPNGYNLTDGGDGNFGHRHTQETRKIISDALRGDKNPSKRSEVREKNAKAHRGKKASIKTRAKMSNAKRGNTNRIGKKHTALSRAKMSETRRCKGLKKRGQLTLFD